MYSYVIEDIYADILKMPDDWLRFLKMDEKPQTELSWFN